MKTMKAIVSGLVVLAMAFAVVSIGETAGLSGTSSSSNPAVSSDIHTMCWAGYCPNMKKYLDEGKRDLDKPRLTVPAPMGSTGF